MRLEGKSAIVTGGTRGIGYAIVLRLAREGADVAFTYVSSDERANQIADEVRALGRKALAIKADAVKTEDAQKVVEETIAAFGKIDILVNNAGITRDTLLMRMSEQDWDAVLDTNLKGVFLLTKAVIRPMMSARKGRIVSISSVVGIVGNPGQANYCASKAGVIGFTKSVAKEVASRGITVNVIAPGYIGTDMTDKLNDVQKQAIIDLVPLKRVGNIEDVASAVIFLASEESGYITGHVLNVDGGMAM
jgi:3-oxoacyl-[acyl-carrier protein] reductase